MNRRFEIKAGCNSFVIAATLQGQRIKCKLSELNQQQLAELYERFKHPYIILKQQPDENEEESKPAPKKRKKPAKPSGENTAGNE